MNVTSAGNSPLGPLPSTPQGQLRFATEKLEAVWLQEVLKSARLGQGSYMGNTLAAKTFQSMFEEAIADKLAEGHALGLSETLAKQLRPAKSS